MNSSILGSCTKKGLQILLQNISVNINLRDKIVMAAGFLHFHSGSRQLTGVRDTENREMGMRVR
jgi:hypothetical protein